MTAWQDLDNYLQAQWRITNPVRDYTGQYDENDPWNRTLVDNRRWNDVPWYDENGFSQWTIPGVTLPGRPGVWTFDGKWFQQAQYPGSMTVNIIQIEPDGSLSTGTYTYPPSSGGVWGDIWGGFTGFVKDVVPIVATVGSVFVIGAGIEAGVAAAAGEGAAVGTAEAGAGWVSAEGGVSYAGGLAADALAPAVVGGAETFAVAAPEVVVSAAPEVSAGWVSAEGGSSYAGGLAADAVVPAAWPSAGGLLDKVTALTPADVIKYGGQINTAVKTVKSVIDKKTVRDAASSPRNTRPAPPPPQTNPLPALFGLGLAAFLFL